MKNFIPILIWTAILAWFGLWLGSLIGDKIEHKTSTPFSVSSPDHINLPNERTMIEATSCDYFFLRKETGEVVNSISETKPLGWQCKEYFHAPAQEISGGKWIVETGQNVTVQITYPSVVTVTTELPPESVASRRSGLAMVLLIVWFLGIGFAKSN